MASRPAIQQFVNEAADPSLNVYASSAATVPVTSGNTAVYITNVDEYTIINVSSPGEPAGNTTEVQFNLNGRMDGDDGLTYNPTTDSLDVLGNLTAANVLTNNLLYANGTAWTFNGSYSNSNVASYLPTYTGNLNVTNVIATLLSGSGANLTNIPAGNITGTVANATHAVTASTANSVAGANVTGTVALATSAETVTTATQSNITSIGSLSGLTVSNSTGVVNFTTTANVTLGAVGNLHISGGSDGQVLKTNGSGVLTWVAQTSFDGANVVTISNAASSTNYNNGALKVTGGVGVGGNVHVLGHIASDTTIYAGHLADFGSWQNPVFVGRDAGAEYVQGALINNSNTGSADWVAYGDSSTTDTGWTDMGFTGTNFSDANYTITKPSDGYVFVQGLGVSEGGPQGGNLVIATGGDGANNDIVFATGSFYANAEYARMDDDSSTFYVGGHAYGATIDNPTPRVVNLNTNGNLTVAGDIIYSDSSVQSTAYAGGVGHMMMIDTNRTDTYDATGSADRPYKTFGAAIAAADTIASSASNKAFTFVLMGCTVTENVSFGGTAFTSITIATTCRSVISGDITIDNNSDLSQLFVRNIEVGGTFTLAGDGTTSQMNSCNFYNTSFSGPVNITATNATAFYETSFFGVVNFTNLSYLYINGAQFNDDWTITADDTGTYPIPSNGLNPGTGGSVSIVFGTIANNVYFVKGGTAAYVFQPHMTRLGRTTESYSIPSGWTVSAYGADFRGTWTNNGTMGMKISGTDNRVLGTAPSYSSIIGGDRVIADLAPATSKGVAGDRVGMIATDASYLYVCTASYTDGVSDIWSRTAINATTWS